MARFSVYEFENPEAVSIWVATVPWNDLPNEYLEEHYGEDFGFGFYDHDSMSTNGSEEAKPLEELLAPCSYSTSYIQEATAEARKRGLDKTCFVFLLFDIEYDPMLTGVSKSAYMEFLGSFRYNAEEIPPTPAQADILAELDHAGGVVQYVIISPGSVSDSPERIHRAAAIFGLQVRDAQMYELAQKHQPDYPASMFFRVTMSPPGPVGRRITFDQFENSDGQTEFIVHGYRQAFLAPPHSLHRLTGSAEELYAEVNRALFGDLDSVTEIFSWSTDWSNYFDAGYEWWGAFLWTLRLPKRKFAIDHTGIIPA
jgi:hypothetical protein